MNKKETRAAFRGRVFKRDGYRCAICGLKADPLSAESRLDAHHITPREEFPNGGYVLENGISLCDPGKSGEDWTTGCHFKAEMVLKGESEDENFSPESLYRAIKGSKEKAMRADSCGG